MIEEPAAEGMLDAAPSSSTVCTSLTETVTGITIASDMPPDVTVTVIFRGVVSLPGIRTAVAKPESLVAEDADVSTPELAINVTVRLARPTLPADLT
jgi:hypothetical protein